MGKLAIRKPVRLDLLYIYALKEQQYKDKYSRFVKFLDNVNLVLTKYETYYPDLTKQIKEVIHEIALAQKGSPDIYGIDLNFSNYVDDIGKSVTDRATCKPIFRKLLKYHPDKGGDYEVFATIVKAYKDGDIKKLTSLYVALEKRKCLVWRQAEGINYWETQAQDLDNKIQVMQQRPEYRIVINHMQGKPKKAKEVMCTYLNYRLLILQQELNFILGGSSVYQNETKEEVC